MRIALFSSTIDPRDGYGNITKEYCMHLHKAGRSFTLFLPRSQKKVIEMEHYPFEIRCVLPEYIYRIYQPKALRYFLPTDVSGFDIVHSLFSFPYCMHALLSARRYGKPFMMGAQGTHGVRPLTYWPERWLMKWCYRSAKAIVVPSQFTKRKIIEYAGVDYPITVIHNGVNFDRFQKQLDLSALRKKYEGKIVLMTVGGLWGRKGHDLVLQALAEIVKQRTDVVYVMVGDGNARSQLEQLVCDLSLEPYVEFAGRQSGDDLVAYFQACDIYVHTPKVVGLKFEGFGIVYLEASACGKPIVATDAGGVRDAIVNGKTGIVVGDEDVPAVTQAILDLCSNSEKRRVMGEAGRAYARKHTWDLIVGEFDAVYQGITKK